MAEHRSPAVGDAGTTLIEILMATVLVGIAFVALLAGLGMVAVGSDMNRKQADAEVVLSSAVEGLRSSAVPFVECADGDDYEEAVRTSVSSVLAEVSWPASTVTVVDEVLWWDGEDYQHLECYDTDDLGHLLRLQLVTVTVTSPDGRATESVAVTKDVAL